MREYLKRLIELAAAGFVAGAGGHVVEHGFELSEASVRGLVTAGLLAGYGVVVKQVGASERPTVK